ncbi:myosin-7-like [Helianthus annuus]|uniref:myosin-7-like n=1 Tax=Helianthus annuus TaxID=4232 RepID=UPI000B8F7220|nr:myosin-7-like [Helianthus annuus]
MVFLASVLESYESLITGKVGNPNMTKEDYDQIDPEEMELIDIKWCMASAMRRAQRFMEITGRSCLGTADTNWDSISRKLLVSSANRKGTLRESAQTEKSRAQVVIQDDEGYDWSKRDNASFEIRKLYAPFKEAQKAKRWDAERECYLDPQGNPVVDPRKVDFDAVANIFPDRDTFHTRRLSKKDYEANLFKRLKEVFEASLPKVMELRKKKEEEIEKLVEEVKKTARDVDEKNDEDQKLTTEESNVPDETEVKILTESSELLNNDQNVDKTEDKCRNCIEMCKACTEKDEKLKSKDIELNKIETIFKIKCKEVIENEEVLKQKIEELTLKCQDFEKENEILRQKCSAKCEDCVQKDNNFQDLQKEYDKMKWSSHRVQEAYDTLKKQVKCMDERLSENLTTTRLMRKSLKKSNRS